jgi:peptidoglycan/xylan/chitin deacetylase (PgdA/CDA1 family)
MTRGQVYVSLAPFRRAFAAGLPILMYHKVARPRRDSIARGLYVTPALFRRQMQELRRAGYASASLTGAPVSSSPNQIVITFDDGFANVLDNALEALREAGFRAIQFLVADRLGRRNDWDAARGDRAEPLMDAAQVRDWLAAGNEIGSHTLSHPRLSQLSRDDARREIADSRKKLQDLFGVGVDHFCYPFGDFNSEVRDLVMAAGYATACGTEPGVNTRATDRFALKRHLAGHRRPGLHAWLPFLPAGWF